MGLIRAAAGAGKGVLSDQWREYFYCDSIPANVLALKGRKRNEKRGNKGSDNIITDGSVVAVADGQCMMIVEQGKIVEVCAEPGEYTFDSKAEPSLFKGDLGEGVAAVFQNMVKRFTYGGEAPVDQRVYYFNTKELMGNKYGTASPVPFRVVDANVGLDIDISIRCFGEYSYRISNPLLFYANVCGNVQTAYTRETLDGQLKMELLGALQPAFARISEKGIRYSSLPGHTTEIADALNEVLSVKWRELRGLEIVSFAVASVKASEEDEAMIKELQRSAALKNPAMAAAQLVGAQAAAMQSAAKNPNGAMMGFMGMNMAGSAGGFNTQELYQMGATPRKEAASGWTCSCGAAAEGNFCPECGKPRPKAEVGWTCSCGAVNKGRFCTECGKKKPEGVPQYRCDKCGWEPPKGSKVPKFCPECGDPFDDGDIVK